MSVGKGFRSEVPTMNSVAQYSTAHLDKYTAGDREVDRAAPKTPPALTSGALVIVSDTIS
jgi:hypothetical protein